MCQILCAVLIAKSLAIMRTIVPLTWDLFVRTAVREGMTTIPPLYKTSQNALTAARTMFLDQANAKFGRKRRQLLKVTKNITYLEANNYSKVKRQS